ncbi:hypothetical protein ACIQEY_11725 [Streptomyces parvus]
MTRSPSSPTVEAQYSYEHRARAAVRQYRPRALRAPVLITRTHVGAD